MNIIRAKRQHAEAEPADSATGATLSRRGVLGGLAALPVLYGIGSATPARAAAATRAGAYGAGAADKLLPNVIGFTPGTALWDPWADVQNGKGIVEDIASNIIKMVVNQDFSSGLEPGPVLDHFPYLAPPPGS